MISFLENVFDATWAWIIVGAVIAGLEIVVPGVFLLWIGLGALATGLILTLSPDMPLAWQLIVFAACMIAAMSLGLSLQKKGEEDPKAATLNREMQGLVGQRTVATSAFVAGRGRIRVQDTTFAAIGEDPIAEGDLVDIVAIEDGLPRVRKA
ncbi:NfeD family protein [Salinarimonas sp.]|uniref:NfeD family protein n=1 Tax=Salinarimonas sp. TaxID=2766526 RepID=UPI00391AE261